VNDADNYERDFNDALPVVAKKCDEVTCSATEMSAWDLNSWMSRLQGRMPNSDAQITLVNRLLTIEISAVEQTESQLAVKQAQKKVDDASTPEELEDATDELNALDIEAQETITFSFSTVL
jgi:hypothetical protein